MSHTTTIKGVDIKDINALKAAVADLQAAGINCELKENCKPRMYYENQGQQCDYVLALPNCRFDVGFAKKENGAYAPVFDEHAGIVAGQIGAACPLPKDGSNKAMHAVGQLMQGYAKHATINQARAEGYMVESATYDKDKNLVITLGSY